MPYYFRACTANERKSMESGVKESELTFEKPEIRRSHRLQMKKNQKKTYLSESSDDDYDKNGGHKKEKQAVRKERVVIQNSPELKTQWVDMMQSSGFQSEKEFMKHLLDLERRRKATSLYPDRIIETDIQAGNKKQKEHIEDVFINTTSNCVNTQTSTSTETPCKKQQDEAGNEMGGIHDNIDGIGVERRVSIVETEQITKYNKDDSCERTKEKSVPNIDGDGVKSSHVKSTKVYECRECNRNYQTYAGLFLHMKVHKSSKQFPCHHANCSYASHYKANLEKHVATVHDKNPPPVKKIACHVCGKMYRKCRLKVHVRSHTGEKPFCCEVCGKTFASQRDLSRHQFIMHSDLTPYECMYEDCGTTFKTKIQLKEHEYKVHLGTKYPCPVTGCSKVFTLE